MESSLSGVEPRPSALPRSNPVGAQNPNYWVSACSVALVVSDSLRPHGVQPARLLCPWDFPGKNTGACCHALLQGIFPTQGLNPCLLCLLYTGGFFTVEPHQGSPPNHWTTRKFPRGSAFISCIQKGSKNTE